MIEGMIYIFAFASSFLLIYFLCEKFSARNLVAQIGSFVKNKIPFRHDFKFLSEREVEEAYGLSALLIVTGVLLLPLSVFASILCMCSSPIPLWSLRNNSTKEIERFRKNFSIFVELLAVSLKGGVDILSSMESAFEVLDGRAKDETRRLLLLTKEKGLISATREFACRNPLEEVKVFYESIYHSKKTGSSLSSVFTQVSQDMRRRMVNELEKKVNMLPQRIVFPMLLLFISALIYLVGPVIIGVRKGVMFL